MFGLLVYQSVVHQNQIDELLEAFEFFNSFRERLQDG